MSTSQSLEPEITRPYMAKVTLQMWLRLRNLRCSGWPRWAQCNREPFKPETLSQLQSEGDSKRVRRCKLLALNTEGDYEPRDVGGLEKPEKVREQILPWSLQKGTSPANTLILAQEELYWTSDLWNSKIINLHKLPYVCANLLLQQRKTNTIIVFENPFGVIRCLDPSYL